MIISLRGTNGSGKSYLVKRLLRHFDAKGIGEGKKGRCANYKMTLETGDTLCVVGNYDIACGGCDSIQPYDNIWPRVVEMIEEGDHALFEGALVSSGYGRIGIATEDYGDDVVFVFLDTPLEICVENIYQRRMSRGKDEPLTDKTIDNVRKKKKAVDNSIVRIRDHHERRVVVLDHRKAFHQMLTLLHEGKIT